MMAIKNDNYSTSLWCCRQLSSRQKNQTCSVRKGQIDAHELKQVEDKAITELIQKELMSRQSHYWWWFRRATWHLDFILGVWRWCMRQLIRTSFPRWLQIDDTFLVGRVELTKKAFDLLDASACPWFEDETTVAKLTIPAPPSQFIEQFIMPMNREPR